MSRTHPLLFMILLGACGSPLELSVDVRGDHRPGMEVVSAEVTLRRAQGGIVERSTQSLGPSDDLLGGIRLLDATALSPGDYVVRVALSDGSSEVVSRERAVRLDDDLAVTILLSRRCEDVACTEGTVCISGRCEPPECGPGDETSCPSPECATPAECPGMPGCFRPECVLRQCLYVADESSCGPVDGGVDAGADASVLDAGVDGGCAAGATEICDNGIDDDCDSMSDCADPECDAQACEDDGNPCTDDTCAASTCEHSARPDGTLITADHMRCCGGALTDVSTDRSHCGACGLACADGFDCTTGTMGFPTCDCSNANVQCHGGMGGAWVCSNVYFVCACRPGMGACPGDAVCIDDPAGSNFCQYP